MAVSNHPELWLEQFPFPRPTGNKYTRGHVLIFGGTVMTGAARLAARAAQRIGAGMVTIAAAATVVPIYMANLESVIVRPVEKIKEWQAQLADPKKDVVLIGPGMGLESVKREYVFAVLATKKPCVLDADALTLFSDRPDQLFAALHSQCVLTPHEGEFVRLFGPLNQDDREKSAVMAASTSHAILLLKGAATFIADPAGSVVVNENAPPWLATAGAGDVLAGMIVGLLAAGMPAFMAASAATWVHGQSASKFGPGLIAEDLIEGIPSILKDLSALAGKPIVG